MNEIEKLREMLENAKFNFTIEELWGGSKVTLMKDGKVVDDAVYHSFSHGYEEGLLESFFLGGCKGYETAEEIFKGWQEMLKELN